MNDTLNLSFNFSEEDLQTLREIIQEELTEAIHSFGTQQRQSTNFKSTKEACEALSISRPTLTKYRKLGMIEGNKVGGVNISILKMK
jgi:hypothetical protein